MGITIASLGLSETQLLRILQDNGGTTPEAIAKAISQNNAAMIERINTLVTHNIADLRNELNHK